ncbi:MAG: DUF4390 domain-containing protein [Acidobacteriota bacterium]
MFTNLRKTSILLAAGLSSLIPATAAGAGGPSPGPHIASLDLKASAGQLEVSFRLEDAFDRRILAKLDAGLEVIFRHHIQVRRKRTFWFDGSVAAKQIETSVILDGLTRQYTLRRKINGGLVETRTTPDAGEMREFMTHTTGILLDLPEKLPLDGKTEVRVRSTLETRFFLFFPYAHQTDWVRLQLSPARGIEVGDGD